MSKSSVDPNHRGPSPFAVIALGAVLLASTLLLAWAVPLTPGRLEHPAATLLPRFPFWAFLAANRPAFLDQPGTFAALLLLACGASFAVCALAVRLLWTVGPRRDLTAIVLGVGVLSLGVTAVAPPNLNSNIWNYMARGRVAAAHGHNPYLTAVDEFPEDPIFPYANHDHTGNPGGKPAAWMVFNIAWAWLGKGDPVRTLFVYRGGLLLFSVGTMLVLHAAARRLRPGRDLAGLALWAWNPIVLMSSLGRTDTVMMFWLVLGSWLLVSGRRRLAVIPLTLSVHVKLVTAPLLAVAALAQARRREFKELAIATAIVAATTVVIWAPFYSDNAGDLVEGYAYVATSAEGSVGGAAKKVATAGFALLVLLIGLTRRGDDLHLLEGWVIIQIYFSLFLAKFASADYLMPLIALVALRMDWRAVLVTFALGLSYFLFDQWYLVGAENFPLPDLFPFPRIVVFFLPPIGAVFYLAVRFARRRLRGPAAQ